MKALWLLLAVLLFAALWAFVDWRPAPDEACEPPPWALIDAAANDARRTAVAPAGPDAHAPSVVPAGESTRAAPADGAPLLMPPGAGTERQPFRISWELLGRANGHVRQDGSLDGFPKELSMLGGNWVELNGFYAPAVLAPNTDELLVMLNRWDGCCIGLPPTAYDSVLAKTRESVDFSQQHQIRFGTLRGRLEIEPFALGGMVLGLYRLEDAELLR